MKRLEQLRDLMSRYGVDAVIIPGTDPHHSEYIADHWKFREWLTGFTGSNGTAVVTRKAAGLWTDSRYFLQAEIELQDSGFSLMREGTDMSIEQWLARQLRDEAKVAIDGRLFSAIDANRLEVFCGEQGYLLAADFYVADRLWTDRPARPMTPVEVHDISLCGEDVDSKVARVMEVVEANGADALFIASLDDIAWLYNIRGRDIERTPVTIAYAYITESTRELFIDDKKLSGEVKSYLKQNNIRIRDYDDVMKFLERRSDSETVMLDPGNVSDALAQSLLCGKVYGRCPVIPLKAVKNETQVEGFRRAMEDDGVALSRLFNWIEKALAAGETITEVDIQTKAIELRQAASDGYVDESFDMIAGYKEHGAIVHYTATPESASTLAPEGLLLIDTGGQYPYGTTDITRTITLGNPTADERRDYTIVLQGHLALQRAVFPKGTRGDQLDALARTPMWSQHLNYGHGTGHGVGHFLCCHEGPQSIRMQHNPIELAPGMVTSNEPGLYRTGLYGIRIENLVLTVDTGVENDFGRFLQFEPLTLMPYDRRLMDMDLLTRFEVEQINEYHRMVFDRLSPRLEGDDLAWLERACAPLER